MARARRSALWHGVSGIVVGDECVRIDGSISAQLDYGVVVKVSRSLRW